MRFESEVLSEQLLPAIRSIIARKLQSDYGLNQAEIAEILDITQPAVSQYLNGKRANQKTVKKLKEDPQTGILIKDAAEKAAKKEEYIEELKDLVSTVRDKGLMKDSFSTTERII